MSAKTYKLRRRLDMEIARRRKAEEEYQTVNRCFALREKEHARERYDLQTSNHKLTSELAALKKRLDECSPFRLNLAEPQWRGDVYRLEVAFSPRAIEYGLMSTSRGEPFAYSNHVHYLCRDLAAKCERLMLDKLAERFGQRA